MTKDKCLKFCQLESITVIWGELIYTILLINNLANASSWQWIQLKVIKEKGGVREHPVLRCP